MSITKVKLLTAFLVAVCAVTGRLTGLHGSNADCCPITTPTAGAQVARAL